MSTSDDSRRRPTGKVSRRSFLVMAGGLTIGTFAMPPLGAGTRAKMRRLIGPPTRLGPEGLLLWTELDEAGEAQVRMWIPDSKAEAGAIEEFYQAAMQVDWDSVVLANVPKPDDDEGDDKADEPQGLKPRRFEFRGGGSEKFWEIHRDSDSYTVTFGRMGTKGKSQTKEVDDEEEAGETIAKLIAGKLAKGYVEVGGLPPVAGRDWNRPESWQEVRKSINIQTPHQGKPAPLPTEAEMDAFEAAHDFKLPPSYRAFLQVLGPGDVNSSGFMIAAPGGPRHHNLEEEFETSREDVENEQKDIGFAGDEYVRREPITRMVVFCGWDSDRWGWDPEEPRSGGEYAIREWSSHGDAKVVADLFPEFIIDKLFHGGLSSWVADGYEDPCFALAAADKKKPAKKRIAKTRTATAPAEAKPRGEKET